MAYLENESLVGTKNGVNKVFTTASNAMEIDNVYLDNTRVMDFTFTTPNTVTLQTAPAAATPLTASYWTTGSLINAGAPYELPSTLDDLLFRVRTMLGEQYSEEWIDRSICDWLNEALNRICARSDWPFMESQSTIVTVVGQEAYQLPAGFKKMIGVFQDGTEITRGTSKESLDGQYFLFDDSIILPVPTVAAETQIRYYRYLPYFDWEDTAQRSKLPRQYEDLLVDYATYRAKQSEELYDVARIHEQAFEAGLLRMTIDLHRRIENDLPGFMPMVNLY